MTDKPEPLELDVILINRTARMSVLTNGMSLPVTHWFNRRGEDCDPEDAVTCVTGTDGLGWFCVDLEAFDYVVMH